MGASIKDVHTFLRIFDSSRLPCLHFWPTPLPHEVGTSFMDDPYDMNLQKKITEFHAAVASVAPGKKH